jgi:hypothetical protein
MAAAVALFPQRFGLDPTRTAQAITRYAGDPGARAELVGRLRLPEGEGPGGV